MSAENEGSRDGAHSATPGESCSVYLDRFSVCANVGSQFHHFYRYGEYEDCEVSLRAWFACLRRKPIPAALRRQSPANDVFEMKDQPSWR